MEAKTTGIATTSDGNAGEQAASTPVAPVAQKLYGLSFNMLRDRALTRAARWHPDGLNSWTPSDWAVAAAGEMGEACNVVKKLNRLRDGMIGNKPGETSASLRQQLAFELADTVMYIDLLAAALNIDLEHSVILKFNAVSVAHGFPERLQYEALSHGYDC